MEFARVVFLSIHYVSSHSWSIAIKIYVKIHLVLLTASRTFGQIWHEGPLSNCLRSISDRLSHFRCHVSSASRPSSSETMELCVIRSLSLLVSSKVPYKLPYIFIYMNDLASNSSLHSSAQDLILHCSPLISSGSETITNIDHELSVLSALVSDLGRNYLWSSTNHDCFIYKETTACVPP